MAEITLRSADQTALIKQADTSLNAEQAAQPPTAATLSTLKTFVVESGRPGAQSA